MDELVDFLRARLDEDEQTALAAVDFDYGVRDRADDGNPVNVHIARHDPARVLREVEAKRRILDELEGFIAGSEDLPQDERRADQATALGIVRLLALPYSDHPAYRAERWRP